MVMPVSTDLGVTAPSTVSTITTTMTQSGVGTFMPPYTISIHVTTSIPVSNSIHVSPHAHIMARLDDWFLAMQNLTMPMTTMEQPYGMPASIMTSLQNNASIFGDNVIPFTSYHTNIPPPSSIHGRNTPQTLTTYSLMFLRQQMDERNHDMVNMLTQQIDTIFNPLNQNTNQSYQTLATQMGRISNFFTPVQLVHQHIPPVQNSTSLQIVEPVF